ncbi:MAG TPA: hypothetical protein DIU39_00120 [Flavobacteriales bacterium]|nr:hypothetical protein [Flavobacteriales bacterium]|tara:strand:- start:148280 stop:148789 length:510 start_codon:yes stop_codon:yes gene_type:complete
MKKLWIIAAVAVSVVACGRGNDSKSHSTDAKPQSMVEETAATTDEATEETTEEQTAEATETAEETGESGEEIYKRMCAACHQPDGKGLAGTFPPLAGSDYLMADKERAIKLVKNGLEGEITVNGEKYTGTMPPQALSNEEIAKVLTYVYTHFNDAEGVTVEEVNKVLGE